MIADDTPDSEVEDSAPQVVDETGAESPGVVSAQAAAAASLSDHFAFAAFASLAQEHPEGNLVFSPADLARLLSLVYAGAQGPTRDEIEAVLGFTPSAEAWLAIDAALSEAVQRPRYRLGLRAQNNRGYGLMVMEILAGSPADRVGILANDLLIAIDGHPMQSEEDFIATIDRSGGVHAIQWYARNQGRVREAEVALDAVPLEGEPSVHLSHRAGAWLQTDYPILPSFAETLAGGFSADVAPLDFTASGEAAATINDWARGHTSESLPDLLSSDEIQADTRLVLASVLAFQGTWETAFDPLNTQPGEFRVTSETAVQVPLMTMTQHLAYAETDSDAAVDLAFKNSFLSLTAILPRAEGSDALALDSERLDAILAELGPQQITLTMPKVEFSFRDSVASSLQSLGVTTMFDARTADLSGMTTAEELRVDDILHACAVKWDEVGAEAVASSAASVVPRSLPGEIVELRFDRPFVFVIRDRRSGAILFLGRITDPSDG